MAEPRTYLIETLGCKANAYDSRRLAEALEALGFRPVPDGRSPHVCILNTCTVTAVADRKSRQRAARLVREYPGSRVFITGCAATAGPEQFRTAGPAGVYGRGEWPRLLEAVNGGPLPPGCPDLSGDFGVHGFGGRVRAFLKVQEGCDAGCAYCILPMVRGRPRSRPLADAVAEAERLAAAGFREIVLTGIHLGLYGRDLGDGTDLAALVGAVAETPGLERLRLSSVEAGELTPQLLDAMRHPAVCPHLHLPLQSGDAQVLRAMRRPYSPAQFEAAVEFARLMLERPAITTDVMVGFPGETEEQFERTLDFCRRVRFGRMHVFPFSARHGTVAAAMPGQLAPAVIARRAARLRRLAAELAAGWAEGFVGTSVRVLFEREARPGVLVGYTDRYVRLSAPGPASLVGRAARVRCTGCDGPALRGQVERRGARRRG